MLKSANLRDIYLKIQYGLSVIFDKIRALGLYCLVIGKACARYDQVGKSRKKAHKSYPRFVEEKISKQKSRLMTFGRVKSDFLVC